MKVASIAWGARNLIPHSVKRLRRRRRGVVLVVVAAGVVELLARGAEGLLRRAVDRTSGLKRARHGVVAYLGRV